MERSVSSLDIVVELIGIFLWLMYFIKILICIWNNLEICFF